LYPTQISGSGLPLELLALNLPGPFHWIGLHNLACDTARQDFIAEIKLKLPTQLVICFRPYLKIYAFSTAFLHFQDFAEMKFLVNPGVVLISATVLFALTGRAATVHDSIDGAYIQAGLNPVQGKQNTK
jgi:hypothetical protein